MLTSLRRMWYSSKVLAFVQRETGVDIWNRMNPEARQFYLAFIDREMSKGGTAEDTGRYLAACVGLPFEPAHKDEGDALSCVMHEILASSVKLLDSTAYWERVGERIENKTGLNIATRLPITLDELRQIEERIDHNRREQMSVGVTADDIITRHVEPLFPSLPTYSERVASAFMAIVGHGPDALSREARKIYDDRLGSATHCPPPDAWASVTVRNIEQELDIKLPRLHAR